MKFSIATMHEDRLVAAWRLLINGYSPFIKIVEIREAKLNTLETDGETDNEFYFLVCQSPEWLMNGLKNFYQLKELSTEHEALGKVFY